jgi:outer membrane protein insertion porin family
VFSEAELTSLVTLHEGDVLSQEKLSASIEAIAAKYWDNGYVHSTTDLKQVRNDENHTIAYHLVVDELSQAVISEIRLEGMTKTKPYVFMREMAFKKGDVFSRAKFQKSAQNIYNTLIVTDVQMDLLDGTEPNTVIPIFKVVEGNQMTIQFGATFGGTVDSFPISGFVQWSDKNLAGTGRDLSISTTLSPDTQQVSVSLGDDWVGDKRWSNALSFDFTRESKSSGLQKAAGSPGYYTGHDTDANLNQPYPAGYDSYLAYIASGESNPSSRWLMKYDYLRFSLGYTSGYTFMFDAGALSISGGLSFGLNRAFYDANKYDPYEYLMKKYHENWQFSNKLSLTFSWDGRDLKQNTTRGYLVSNQFIYAGGILGGLSNYLKESLSFSWYVSPFKYKLGEKDAPVTFGMTTAVNWMLPQFWNNTDSNLDGKGWGWYGPKTGSTRYEMLYIDGMNIGRGFDVVYDQSFLWNNEVSLGAPIVLNVLNWEVFASATAVTSAYDSLISKGFNSLNWYFAMGAGIKLKISGFPLGLYLVKNAQKMSGSDFSWVGGSIFSDGSKTSGLKLVLAITQTIY